MNRKLMKQPLFCFMHGLAAQVEREKEARQHDDLAGMLTPRSKRHRRPPIPLPAHESTSKRYTTRVRIGHRSDPRYRTGRPPLPFPSRQPQLFMPPRDVAAPRPPAPGLFSIFYGGDGDGFDDPATCLHDSQT